MKSDGNVIEGLNGLLADATVFYQKLRHYHWNITGKRFLTAIHERADAVIQTAEAVGDRGTVNMLDALNDSIEKDRWMLRAWNEEAERAWS